MTVEISPQAGTQDFAAAMAAVVGHHYRVQDYYEIGREKVREYARAVQDLHPAHHDDAAAADLGYEGLVAPLTFISLVGTLAQRRLFEDVIHGYDLSQIMQTDQVLEFHRPIRVGDRLVCDVYLDSFRQMAGTDIIVTKNVVSNQNNDLVQTTYTTLVGRTSGAVDDGMADLAEEVMMHNAMGNKSESTDNPTVNTDSIVEVAGFIPPVLRSHTSRPAVRLADIEVGTELPPRSVRLTRGDLVNYAGVAGDANPIHWSEELAEKIGLEAPVAHGMLTMGLGAGFLTSWIGDPGAVREYNVRFVSPVFVHSDRAAQVEYTGKVRSINADENTATIAITATSAGKKIFGRATAVVELA